MDTDDWTKIVQHMLEQEAASYFDTVSTQAGQASERWVGVVKAAIEATDADRDQVLRAIALEIVGEG